MVGPSLGGLLLDCYDFGIAMTAVGFLNLAVAFVLVFYKIIMLFQVSPEKPSALPVFLVDCEPSQSKPDDRQETYDRPFKKHVKFLEASDSIDEHDHLLTSDNDITTYGT